MGCIKSFNKKNSQPISNQSSTNNRPKDQKIQSKVQGQEKQQELPHVYNKSRNSTDFKENQKQQKGPQNKLLKLFLQISQGQQEMRDYQLFDFFINSLEIQVEDKVVGFILIEIMKLQKIEKISFENFKNLFLYCQTQDAKIVKKTLPEIRKKFFCNRIQYDEIYLQLHALYSGNKTTIDLEVAEQLWIIYLKDIIIQYPKFKLYLESIEDKQNIKIHHDLWKMMLNFSYEVKNIQNNYSEDDGWPLFIDNFVEFIKEN